MAKFPEQLKKYRNKKNLSQKDLAGKLFISRQAISKWESGE
ncbi:helix-turn-helix transcriptional regulator, partial [Oenococcus oeni]